MLRCVPLGSARISGDRRQKQGWPNLGELLAPGCNLVPCPTSECFPYSQNVLTVGAICSSHISQLVTGEGEHVLPIFTFHRLIRSKIIWANPLILLMRNQGQRS